MMEIPGNFKNEEKKNPHSPEYDIAIQDLYKNISLERDSYFLKRKIEDFVANKKISLSDEERGEILASDEISKVLKSKFTEGLSKEYFFKLYQHFTMLNEINISEEAKENIINSNEVSQAVKDKFIETLSKEYIFKFYEQFKLLDSMGLSQETKQQITTNPEVFDLVKDKFTQNLSKEYLFNYKKEFKVLSDMGLPEGAYEKIINSNEASQAMKSGLLKQIKGAYYTKCKEAFETLASLEISEETKEKVISGEEVIQNITQSFSSVKPEEKIKALIELPPTVFKEVFNSTKDESFFTHIITNIDTIPSEFIDFLEKEHSLKSYKKDLGIPHIETYKKYLEFKKSGDAILLQGFIAENKKFVGSMIGSDRFDNSRRPPYYKDYVDMMYPNNSTSWTSYEKNEKCEDRTQDIEGYTFPKKGYEIELLSGRSMVLSEGETVVAKEVGKIESLFKTKEENEPLLEEKEFANLNKNEQASLLFLKALINEYPIEKLKELFLSRHQEHEGVSVEKTLEDLKTKAGSATNQEYAYLLSLREFFIDNIKETMSSILEEGLESPNIRPLLEKFYKEKRIYDNQHEQKQKVAQLRPETIGMEGNLAYRVNQILQQKSDNFNLLTKDENGNTILDKKGLAIERLIDNEHIRAAQVIEILTGEKIDPKDVYLGDFSIDKYLTYKEDEIQGKYDEKLFTTYLSQLATSLFENEVKIIDKELKKFRSADEDGPNLRRKKVIAHITKNKPSANARQVGGVCVAGDLQMWNDPKFFQMIFKDPDQVDCKGLIMLHAYEDQGRKVLTASMNPSSTYLYSTDEKVFFDGIARTLGEFAQSNGFDVVAVSKISAIRTNRTGGTFEKAMNEKIKEVGESYHLSKPQNFSYNKAYTEQDLDVIWKKS